MSDNEVSYVDYTPEYLHELKESALSAWTNVTREFNINDYNDDKLKMMYNNIMTKLKLKQRGNIEDHVNLVIGLIQDIRNYKNLIAVATTKRKQKLDDVNANWNAKYKGGDLVKDFTDALLSEGKQVNYHISGGKLSVGTFHQMLANG